MEAAQLWQVRLIVRALTRYGCGDVDCFQTARAKLSKHVKS